MKLAILLLVSVAALVAAVEEKKTEKRGVLGLGYGGLAAAPAPLLGHGYYGHGLYDHGLYGGGLYNHGLYGGGLYNHGLYGGGLYNHGLYGHGLYNAPLISKTVAAPIGVGAPWLGFGHGYLH